MLLCPRNVHNLFSGFIDFNYGQSLGFSQKSFLNCINFTGSLYNTIFFDSYISVQVNGILSPSNL